MRSRSRSTLNPVLAALAAAALTGETSASPPGSQFQLGDLYLSSNALPPPGGGASFRGLVRIDPATGATQVLLAGLGAVEYPTLAFDPFRDRLLLSATIGAIGGLWAVDAAGAAQNLLTNGVNGSGPAQGYRGIAPAGDGRVYLSSSKPGERAFVQWIDATGALHTLLDETGATPFAFDDALGSYTVELLYHAPTNSLVAATSPGELPCPTGSAGINLYRLPISADGSRLSAPALCVRHQASPSPTEPDQLQGSLSHGPDGMVLFGVWNNGGLFSQAALLDPATMQSSLFSSASPSPHATTFSRTRGRAVVLNTGLNTLAYYGPGQAAPGQVFATSGVSGGGSGEKASLVEINGAWSNSGFTTFTDEIALSTGGTQVLALDVDDQLAGATYVVLGSLDGWFPGFGAGPANVPLNVDAYTLHTLYEPNTFPLSSSFGALGAGGQSQTSFFLPPLNLPGLAGLRFYHAAVVLGPSLAVSNPLQVELVP